MKLSKSLSDIEKLYFEKCFRSVRAKADASAKKQMEGQVQIFVEQIPKPKAKVLSSSSIRTAVFFHVLLKHGKNAPICSTKDYPSELTVELINKDAEIFEKAKKKCIEIYISPERLEELRLFAQKVRESKNFPYDIISYTGSEGKTGEEE